MKILDTNVLLDINPLEDLLGRSVIRVGSQLQSLGILDGPLDQFPRARWVNVFKRPVVCQPFDDLRVLARINQMIKHIFDAQTIHIKEKDRQADLTRGVLS